MSTFKNISFSSRNDRLVLLYSQNKIQIINGIKIYRENKKHFYIARTNAKLNKNKTRHLIRLSNACIFQSLYPICRMIILFLYITISILIILCIKIDCISVFILINFTI
jgi:hypothetical protein